MTVLVGKGKGPLITPQALSDGASTSTVAQVTANGPLSQALLGMLRRYGFTVHGTRFRANSLIARRPRRSRPVPRWRTTPANAGQLRSARCFFEMSDSSQRTRSIAAMTAGSSGSNPSASRLGLPRRPRCLGRSAVRFGSLRCHGQSRLPGQCTTVSLSFRRFNATSTDTHYRFHKNFSAPYFWVRRRMLDTHF